jgi:hypothetical protein
MPTALAAITPYIPTVSGTLYYTAWVATAIVTDVVAFKSFFHPEIVGPVIFASVCIGIHVIGFNWLVKMPEPESYRRDSLFLQRYVAIACLVMSSVASVFIITQASMYAILFYTAYTKQKLASEMLLQLAVPLALLGWGIPITRILYARGLELMRLASWSPMEHYLQRSKEERGKISLIWDQLLFCSGIIHPASIQSIPFNQAAQEATIDFFTTEEKKQVIEHHLKYIQDLSDDFVDSEGPISWELAVQYFTCLSDPDQDKFLDKLLLAARPMQGAICAHLLITTLAEAFPPRIKAKIEEKQRQLQEFHPIFVKICQEQYEKITSSQTLELEHVTIADDLIRKIISHSYQVNVFCPDLDVRALRQIQRDLQLGETSNKMRPLRSPSAHIVDEEWTSFYLVRNYVDADQRVQFAQDLQTVLGGDIDTTLSRHGIDKMDAFIEKVFKGDRALLHNTAQNRTQVLRNLKAYLRDPQIAWYTWMVGEIKQKGSAAFRLATKVAYYATFVLQIWAIIASDLQQCAGGMLWGAVGYIAYQNSPSYQRVWAIVSQHHFLNILAIRSVLSPVPATAHDYADIFGTMRVLSLQLMIGEIAYTQLGAGRALFMGAALAYRATEKIFTLLPRSWRAPRSYL